MDHHIEAQQLDGEIELHAEGIGLRIAIGSVHDRGFDIRGNLRLQSHESRGELCARVSLGRWW